MQVVVLGYFEKFEGDAHKAYEAGAHCCGWLAGCGRLPLMAGRGGAGRGGASAARLGQQQAAWLRAAGARTAREPRPRGSALLPRCARAPHPELSSARPPPRHATPPCPRAAAAQKNDAAAFLKTTSKEVAAALGISGKAGPAFALGRAYEDFGEEAVAGEGHAAFEGAWQAGRAGQEAVAGEGHAALSCAHARWLGAWRPGRAHVRRAVHVGCAQRSHPRASCSRRCEWRPSRRPATHARLPACTAAPPAEKDLEKAIEAFVTAEKLPAFLEFTQVRPGGWLAGWVGLALEGSGCAPGAARCMPASRRCAASAARAGAGRCAASAARAGAGRCAAARRGLRHRPTTA